jgi:hypothetical protein
MNMRFGFRALATLTLLGGLQSVGVAAPTVADILADQFKPKIAGIDITTPTAAETAACTVELETIKTLAGGKKHTAWVLKDGQGRVLRKFHDTTGANTVDLYAYYKDGEEAFRQLDTNGNSKLDQYRWLGPNGSKVGLDVNEDGTIDTWSVISPEEVSQEILAAVIAKDAARLQALMLTKNDLQSLGLPQAEANRIQAKMAGAGAQFQKTTADLAKLPANTIWVHLEVKQPQTVPADSLGSATDLVRYKHGTILYQEGDGEKAKHNWLQTGEMIQVGKAWRIIQGPIAGMQPPEEGVAGGAGPEGSLIPKGAEKLVERLKELDTKGPAKAGREGIAEYNLARAALLEQIAALAKEDTRVREVWVRQAIESYAAASQQMDKSALERLGQWKAAVAKDQPGSNLLAYIQFREMSGDYAFKLSQPGLKPADIQKLQDTWRETLAKFVTDFPKAEDAPDALMQLGMLNEFIDKTADATKWYDKLAKDFPGHVLSKKAQGCLYRLNLEGAPFVLAGKTLAGGDFTTANLRGKAVVVYFWASWNGSAAGDFTKVKQALSGLAGKAELVGVNLDAKAEEAAAFLKANPVPGTHLYAAGGQDGALATQYGITVLPMVFIVGPDGKVVNRNAQAATLEEDLKKLLAPKDKDK